MDPSVLSDDTVQERLRYAKTVHNWLRSLYVIGETAETPVNLKH